MVMAHVPLSKSQAKLSEQILRAASKLHGAEGAHLDPIVLDVLDRLLRLEDENEVLVDELARMGAEQESLHGHYQKKVEQAREKGRSTSTLMGTTRAMMRLSVANKGGRGSGGSKGDGVGVGNGSAPDVMEMKPPPVGELEQMRDRLRQQDQRSTRVESDLRELQAKYKKSVTVAEHFEEELKATKETLMATNAENLMTNGKLRERVARLEDENRQLQTSVRSKIARAVAEQSDTLERLANEKEALIVRVNKLMATITAIDKIRVQTVLETGEQLNAQKSEFEEKLRRKLDRIMRDNYKVLSHERTMAATRTSVLDEDYRQLLTKTEVDLKAAQVEVRTGARLCSRVVTRAVQLAEVVHLLGGGYGSQMGDALIPLVEGWRDLAGRMAVHVPSSSSRGSSTDESWVGVLEAGAGGGKEVVEGAGGHPGRGEGAPVPWALAGEYTVDQQLDKLGEMVAHVRPTVVTTVSDVMTTAATSQWTPVRSRPPHPLVQAGGMQTAIVRPLSARGGVGVRTPLVAGGVLTPAMAARRRTSHRVAISVRSSMLDE